MEILENTLGEPLGSVLDRPLFCFLGTATPDGQPRVSPLWFLWEDSIPVDVTIERISRPRSRAETIRAYVDRYIVWIIADTLEKSYTKRVEQRPETALAVVDFDVYTGRVEHVGMRGRAAVAPLERDRTRRLLRKYLGEETDEWDPRFVDLDPDRWSFIRFEPDTVVARDQSFSPSLER